MTQRRTPSGQRPARRPGQPGRGAGVRASRTGAREPIGRAESRAAAPRLGAVRGGAAPRSANRPAAARRAAAAGGVRRTSAPQPRRFTGRVTALVAVLVALALAYTYPVRVYLNQQSDIARMEAAQRQQTELIGKLSEEAAKWKDDEYVRIQARQRFYMAYPGETLLVTLPDEAGAARDAGLPPPGQKTTPEPWYDTLWSSIRAANDEKAPTP
ncbi:septum formation initiator family protein [Micromonospora sp. NPDC049559]|uniref:septum formation initiator family protein n=1 Tax=Micromonospora sp. NPDC049559 TaxID=3155923 RepID=UPI003428F6AD